MRIHAAGALLDGDLTIPPAATGMVLFTQNRPRDRAIAEALRERGLATLLIEPLTAEERADEALRFDMDLLADRLIGTLRWLRTQPVTAPLPIGIFGTGAGAGAALVAAAARPGEVQTVVTRGGRADLAGGALARVQAPTLLIAGERDPRLRALNEEARRTMQAPADLCVIPDADRYFTGTRALEQVIIQAADWFSLHLAAPAPEHAMPTVDSALPVKHTRVLDVLTAPLRSGRHDPDNA
ncbi:dienelactone hydrolase [Actinoplanes octamycinicus]|uniref:Dienelactone hydrolase n=1 Tax=Actinoplanes octamycinicus TaxID=135948 RepID=A0A7W7M9P4_9ACTN|nr:hydrolase [Actinoplanes octamycinicus]MBB4742248.1 dienelactone hydrolase [Actinoplanes octamycinicus]GIE59907.1 hydrolase [Actinoplanes octamycinicus]